MNKDLIKMLPYFGAGVIVGGTISFLVTKQVLKSKYEARSNEEIDSVKEHYKLLRKEGEFSSPATAVHHYYEQADPIGDEIDKAMATAEVVNYTELAQDYMGDDDNAALAFATGEINMTQYLAQTGNLISDIPDREEGRPYVITLEEFEEPEFDHYTKLSIVYFEGDDTLCDDADDIIQDVDNTIGNDTLLRFGYGTTDKDVVHARNENTETDFEVCRDKRGYNETILGMRPDKAELRKMRGDD